MPQLSGTVMHGANLHSDQSRRLFIPVTIADVPNNVGNYAAAEHAAAGNSYCYASVRVPANFVSAATVKAVLVSANLAGNAVFQLVAAETADGESYYGDSVSGSVETVAIPDHLFHHCIPVSLPAMALGDYLGLKLRRFGDDANDTFASPVYCVGFVIDYLADQ